MMNEGVENKILVVEDDLDVAEMLTEFFRAEGYQVSAANWGEDAIKACQSVLPGLIILDIRLPDIDGFEVARRLRSNRRTKDVPIIFLTEKRERNDRLKGLQLQADDYITKPFDIQELRLRVRNTFAHSNRLPVKNAVTGLPDGQWVEQRLQAALQEHQSGIIVVAVKNLEQFREQYGFVASDDLLRAVGLMLDDLLKSQAAEDFVGHLSPTHFVVVVQGDHRAALKERIRKRLEQSLDYFYNNQDLNRGVFDGDGLILKVEDLALEQIEVQNLQQLVKELEQLVS